MKKENNIIHTKENPMQDIHKELYPIEKEDKEIMRLEKTCDIMSILLKVEMVITLVVVTFAFMFNGFEGKVIPSEYKQASISTEIE